MIRFLHQVLVLLLLSIPHHLRRWIQPDNYALLPNAAVDIRRSRAELVVENAFLRQQLIVLKRQVKRPVLEQRERVLLVLLAGKLRAWEQALLIVQPETRLRWHRELFRRIWRRKSRPKRKRGRKLLKDDVVALIKRMADTRRFAPRPW